MAENTKHKTTLPDGWCDRVRSAMLGVISLAQYAMAATRSWAVNSPIARLRLKAENDQSPLCWSNDLCAADRAFRQRED